MYYDRDGAPISIGEWSELLHRTLYRIVARTEIGHDVIVSTVWIGLDHRFGEPGAPLIFETMIFGGIRDGDMWRYATVDDAAAGHAAVVAELS